ncbi:MAG: ABC transporter ATP-binding protein/permease [Firmicutes bacterium]|nr:ABC transporter ATP-binding protein/permease [Bacillota bacterium]
MLRIYRFLKPFAPMVAGVLVLLLAQAMGDLYLPTLMAEIINQGVMLGDIGKIIQIGELMLLVAAGVVVCALSASFLASRTAAGLGTILRSKVFGIVESYSLNEFVQLGTATLITRTTNDINQIQMVTVIIMRMMVRAPLMAVGGIFMAVRQERQLVWVLAVALPLLSLIIVLIISRALPLFKLIQKKIDKINLVLREKLTGIRVIRAFDTVEYERRRFDQANVDLTGTYIKVNRIMVLLMPSITLVMSFTSVAVLWFGGLLIGKGTMNLGALLAFTQYTTQILMSMLMMTLMFVMVPRAQTAALRINEILELKPEITDPPGSDSLGSAPALTDPLGSGLPGSGPVLTSLPVSGPSGPGSLELDPATAGPAGPAKAAGGTGPAVLVPAGKGLVEFRQVTFTYRGAEMPALQDISFTARPGEVTAIIGSTGAGKSTLINLIPRFYDIDSGQILIDGIDIREMTQAALRAQIGLVPQKAVLFSGTIAENVRFGHQQATDEEVRHAVAVAQGTAFVTGFDDGFDHQISQGGANLSGGQKQRLAIARALVKKPAIYIFDDSFSALDFKTDALLRAALKEETVASTVLMVAQRAGTVMDADRIIVLDQGRIAGLGTHRELLQTCVIYREIVSSQLAEEEIA